MCRSRPLFYAACFGHAHVREILDHHGGTAVGEPAVDVPAVERRPGERMVADPRLIEAAATTRSNPMPLTAFS